MPISFLLTGCFVLVSFPYTLQRPMPNLSTLAWVEGPCKTRLLKMNRTYHKSGPSLWVEILPFGPHETKPHISCFFCMAVQGNSSHSPVQHSDFPPSIDWTLAFNSVLTCKNINSASKKKCGSWEKSAESYRSTLRKWRHLYFSHELWVLVGIQAAGTWRFNGGWKLIGFKCGKKGFPFIV